MLLSNDDTRWDVSNDWDVFYIYDETYNWTPFTIEPDAECSMICAGP